MEKGFRAPAVSKLQETSAHFMANILEYGTSCQTWTFWNQIGFEISICRLLVYKLQSKLSVILAECFLYLMCGPSVVCVIGINKYSSAIFILSLNIK